MGTLSIVVQGKMVGGRWVCVLVAESHCCADDGAVRFDNPGQCH